MVTHERVPLFLDVHLCFRLMGFDVGHVSPSSSSVSISNATRGDIRAAVQAVRTDTDFPMEEDVVLRSTPIVNSADYEMSVDSNDHRRLILIFDTNVFITNPKIITMAAQLLPPQAYNSVSFFI